MKRSIVCCIIIAGLSAFPVSAEQNTASQEHDELLKMEQELVQEITGSTGSEEISPRMEPQVREFTPASKNVVEVDVIKTASIPTPQVPSSKAVQEKRVNRDRAISSAIDNIMRRLPEEEESARAQMNPAHIRGDSQHSESVTGTGSEYVISRKVVYVDEKNDGRISSISIKPEIELRQDHALNKREEITFRSYDDEDDMWAGEQIPLFYHGRTDPALKKQIETNSTGIASVLQKQRDADKREEERFKNLEAKIDKIAKQNTHVVSLEKQVSQLAEQNEDLLKALGDLQTEVRSQPTRTKSVPIMKERSRPLALRDADPYLEAIAVEQPELTQSAFFGGYNEQVVETTGTVLFHEVPGFDGPGTFYTQVLRFQRGARVRITSVRDGWARIVTDQGDRAWVRATDIRFS